MKRIFKYKIDNTSEQDLELPPYCRILKCAMQGADLMVWVLLEDNYIDTTETWKCKFFVYGTGHTIRDDAIQYLDTIFDSDGFTWHVFYDFSYDSKVPYNKYPKKNES